MHGLGRVLSTRSSPKTRISGSSPFWLNWALKMECRLGIDLNIARAALSAHKEIDWSIILYAQVACVFFIYVPDKSECSQSFCLAESRITRRCPCVCILEEMQYLMEKVLCVFSFLCLNPSSLRPFVLDKWKNTGSISFWDSKDGIKVLLSCYIFCYKAFLPYMQKQICKSSSLWSKSFKFIFLIKKTETCFQ